MSSINFSLVLFSQTPNGVDLPQPRWSNIIILYFFGLKYLLYISLLPAPGPPWRKSTGTPFSLPDNSTTTGFSLSADKSVIGSYSSFDNMLTLPPIIQKWFIFPSSIPHLPGKCMSEKRRICVGADYWYA